MEKLKRSLGSFVVPLLSIILAFVIGGIIMAALGANPFDAVKYLFQGAFGSKANIGTTLTKATPLMFTSLCACFAYKCGVFNLGGEGQFLMGSIAAFVTAYFSGVTGFAGVLLALLAVTLAGGILLACLFFGFCDALQIRLQVSGIAIPYQFFQMIPYVATVVVLSVIGTKQAGPKANGQPYRREQR